MDGANKLRVVIDTNLVISAAIISDSLPDHLLRAWQQDRYALLFSEEMLEELKDVSKRSPLVEKYHLLPQRIARFISSLELAAVKVQPLPASELPVRSRDPKDNFLLACAFAGEADYLITGDKDLLVLNGDPRLGQRKIVSAKEFLALIRQK